jgi:hypothetical protein
MARMNVPLGMLRGCGGRAGGRKLAVTSPTTALGEAAGLVAGAAAGLVADAPDGAAGLGEADGFGAFGGGAAGALVAAAALGAGGAGGLLAAAGGTGGVGAGGAGWAQAASSTAMATATATPWATTAATRHHTRGTVQRPPVVVVGVARQARAGITSAANSSRERVACSRLRLPKKNAPRK